MARPRPWINDIPRILKALEVATEQSFSRRDIQALFGIGRSAAVELMNVAGVTQGSEGHNVSRRNLLQYVKYHPDFQVAIQEQARRAKLAEKLHAANADAKLRGIALPVTP